MSNIQKLNKGDAADVALQATIDSAVALAWKDNKVSKLQAGMDKVGNMILGADPNNSTMYATASAFVGANSTAVQEVVTSAANAINVKAIEDGIKSFAESSKVIMNALDSVSQIHPVIGVVVLAFKAVITLELKRRSNDQKVIAIKLKMKDMVAVLLDLRGIKDPQQAAPDGSTIEGRLQDLMRRIADDITKCGNACDTYTKKHVLVKVIKSPIWEGKLAGYGDLFDTYRKEIQFAMSIHTTLGVEEANEKLENLGDTVHAIEDGVNMLKLLRVLDSPREKEIWKLVKSKGGPKACLEDDTILKELAASKACQLTNSQGVVDTVKLGEVKQSLKEDVEKSLSANFTIFEKKMELQMTQLTLAMDRMVVRESDRVISAITSGPHDRVVDKDLHQIWKDMSWKSSVKARHFVLAVHDYFIQKLSAAALAQERLEMGTVYSEDGGKAVSEAPPKTEYHEDDSWTLDYINLSRVPAILEAFDDDGSGFINVVEVNQFTSSRPKDWSLLHWIAYWAEGWHYSIWDYRTKIGSILDAMHALLHSGDVHRLNQSQVNYYLTSGPFYQIDLLVRAVALYIDENTSTLEEKMRPYVDDEENRLRDNLNRVGWNIDGFDTLTLVTGPGRIERYLFPLLYLVLDRHLRVLRRSFEDIFDEAELRWSVQTLSVIMEAAAARMRTLLAVLRQRSANASILLGNVAFGMFKLLNDPTMEDAYVDEDYNGFPILEYDDDESNSSEKANLLKFAPVTSIVNWDGYQEITMVESDQQVSLIVDGAGLQGMWTGQTFDSEGFDTDGLMHIHINSVDGDKFKGIGMNKFGLFTIDGKITLAEDTQHKVTFDFEYMSPEAEGETEGAVGEKGGGEYEDDEGKKNDGENDKGENGEDNEEENEEESEQKRGGAQAATEGEDDADAPTGIYDGTFDISTFTITGTWRIGIGEMDGTFNLGRRPAFAYQFKYTSQEFQENAARARWKYALSAIRHQVQKQLWSWNYLKARVETRKRYLDLRLRKDTENVHNVHPAVALSENEIDELNRIEEGLSPPDIRYYLTLVNEASRLRCIHYGINCDGCGGGLIGGRMLCLTCISPNYEDHMDFCDRCFDITRSDRGFDHYPEHDSLLMYRVLSPRERRRVVDYTRGFASFGRTSLANQEGDLLCVSCSTAISLPCWICLACDSETYICIDCQKKKDPTFTKESHTSSHSLIRLSDTSALSKTVEATVEALDERLGKDMANVHSRMDKLEEIVNERIDALEVLVQQRLSKVEELLMQILASAPKQDSA